MNKSQHLKTDKRDRLLFERRLWKEKYTRIMGVDEVGRGCLSGPVVAAGVIFKEGVLPEGIRDSKQLKFEQRKSLSKYIKKEAEYWTIQSCSPSEIDELNILNASIKAMNKCVESPGADPDYLLVDGNRFGACICPHQCLVEGDDRSVSIAAASIIAKVYRDELMISLHEKYPHFGWDTNVGYPTEKHFKGLKKHGITKHHRKSFRLRTKKTYKIS